MKDYLASDGYRNDFTVDKAAKMVFINGEFYAEFSLVWDALPNRKLLNNG